MNIVIMTGSFSKRPSLKNGVAFGTFKTDKMFLTVVAFNEIANEMAKQNTTDLLLVEGTLQQNKYNDEWRTQVVVKSIRHFGTAENAQLADELDMGGDLESVDTTNDDLPF